MRGPGHSSRGAPHRCGRGVKCLASHSRCPQRRWKTCHKDHIRQITVAVGAAVAIAGAAWGSGAFGGTPIAQAADGALASDATLLAPATPAFAIWSAIYGLLAALRRGAGAALARRGPALPRGLVVVARVDDPQRGMDRGSSSRLDRRRRWPSCSGSSRFSWSSPCRLDAMKRPGFVDALATEASTGLYLGWAAVASAANIAAAAGRRVHRVGIGADCCGCGSRRLPSFGDCVIAPSP